MEEKKDSVFKCTVDTVLHPTAMEDAKRLDKATEMWTMFKTYLKNGMHYEPRLCVGMAPHIDVGDTVTLIGELVDTGKYGLQFKFSGLQKNIPSEVNGLITFFERNLTGVGFVLAERIIDHLGISAVEMIENDYKCLSAVSGISEKKAIDIYNQITCMHSSLDELKFFAKTGLGVTRIAAVKNYYKSISKPGKPIDVIALIKANPYQLIEDVKGIGFKIADNIAINVGIPADDPNRIMAGLKFALKEEVEAKGNIWTEYNDLIKLAAGKSYLNIAGYLVEDVLKNAIKDKILIEENKRIYLPNYYQLEIDLADYINEMQKYPSKTFLDSEMERGIEKAEKAKERTLDEGQKDAVKTSINSNVSIITGGPGTGKTTTLDTLLYFLEEECNMKVTLCAPTGRAAKRMTEQTHRDASTIHSLVLKKSRDDFTEKRFRHVIVVDESSMIDLNVLKMLIDICDVSTKLIFVGDIDQLPSIGPGQILRDMIESGVIPTSRLNTIHRQSENSHIITNAHLIINGKHVEKDFEKDFFVLEKEDEEGCLKSLKSLITKQYPNKLGVKPSEIQILAPLKRGTLGVANLNKIMQEIINPADSSKREIDLKATEFGLVMREGDRVIQTKNDYNIPCEDGSEGVFNGEIGIIDSIVEEDDETHIYVDFGDRTAQYNSKAVNNLSLAYAITVHKSQGSEFRTVIIPLFLYTMPMIYNRNLLYTAVTRAKEYCCIVGKRETVNKMIHNNKVNRRRTTFAIRLNGESDEFYEKLKAKKKKTTRTRKKKTT